MEQRKFVLQQRRVDLDARRKSFQFVAMEV